jgi:hypothetical protein
MAIEMNHPVFSESPVFLTNLTPDTYFTERVNAKIAGYTRLSRIYRGCYLLVGSLSIISSAAVPVLINTSIGVISPTILSLVVTILVALERLFRFREHWRNFSFAEEALKREKYLYQAKAGEYGDKEQDEAFRLFVRRFEEKVKEERIQSLDERPRESGSI